jgi:hypothetical protein
MAEFFAVVTNHRRVTNPRTPAEALEAIDHFLAMPGLRLIAQPVDIVARWSDLVRQHPVRGADVFDVQIAATNLASGIGQLYTFNRDDFERFPPGTDFGAMK